MLLFVYTTTHKRFEIFTCRYFKLSWNTTALNQSNWRNFSCSSITFEIHPSNCTVYSLSSELDLFFESIIKTIKQLLLWTYVHAVLTKLRSQEEGKVFTSENFQDQMVFAPESTNSEFKVICIILRYPKCTRFIEWIHNNLIYIKNISVTSTTGC